MLDGIHKASGSLNQSQKYIEIISNNLANLESIGYKRQIPFVDELKVASREKIPAQYTDFNEGDFTKTSNPFDLAVSGNAFFMVETENGKELTKNGKFKISEEGILVNDDGLKVMSNEGEIDLKEVFHTNKKAVQINQNGEIVVDGEVINKLMIVEVKKENNIKRTSGQNFDCPENDYTIAENGKYTVVQGYLEQSNVNAIIEMQEMIKLNKNYESSAKIIKSFEDIMSKDREIGRV